MKTTATILIIMFINLVMISGTKSLVEKEPNDSTHKITLKNLRVMLGITIMTALPTSLILWIWGIAP